MVNWSPKLGTAVSDLEVEYSEEPGHMYYFRWGGAMGVCMCSASGVYARWFVHVCVRARECVWVCMHACVRACVRACVSVCVCVCMCMCVCV